MRVLNGAANMGHLNSPHKEITHIVVSPFPSKAQGINVVRIRRTIVGVGKNGSVYSNHCTKAHIMYAASSDAATDVVCGLFKLGRISKEMYESHLHQVKAQGQYDDDAYKAKDILENAKGLNLTLSNGQKQALAHYIKLGK